MEAKNYILIGAGIAAVIAVVIVARKGAGLVKDAAEAINPLNNDNIINKGFTSLYQGVTGSDGTLGTDIYDATHDGKLDVTSQNNAIYSGISKLGETVTGNNDWSLGGAIYDWTH